MCLLQILTHKCKQAEQARHSRRRAGDGGAGPDQITGAPAELVKVCAVDDSLPQLGSTPPLSGRSCHGCLDTNGAVEDHRAESTYESADESQPDYLTAAESEYDEPGTAGREPDPGGLNTHTAAGSSSLAPSDRARKAAGILGVPEYSLAAQLRPPPALASLHQSVPGGDPSGHSGHAMTHMVREQPHDASARAGEPAGESHKQDVDPHVALTWAALEQLPLTCEPVLQVQPNL